MWGLGACLLLIIPAVMLPWTTSAASCPSSELIVPCLCSTRGEEIQIWCSQSEVEGLLAGLKSVASHVTSPVDELILENNVLPSLPGRAFAPLRVVRLMLRDNKLERVASSWLGGLEDYLLEVFLVEPSLKSLPEDSLEGLPKLEAVTLRAGPLPRLPNLAGLGKLRYIYLQLPMLNELSPIKLKGLDSLEQFHVVGSPYLSKLDSGVLQDMPRLISANFSDCGVQWIHPRAMARLPSLKELAFSNNHIRDAGEVGRSVRELPLLAILRIDGNLIDALKETSFVDIPPLREIYLNGNRITEIHRGAFHRLPSLRTLDLSDNMIQRVHPEFFLQPYDNALEDLILTNNRLDHVMHLSIILDVLPRLRFLDLSYNRLEDIMFGSMRGHMMLERLHLDHNQLKRVVREAFSAMPALRELRLRNNSLSNYLEMPLWNLPALKGLDLSYNEFRRLDRRVLANLPSLRRLDMSRNNLVVVDPAAFLGTAALESVNLSHNAIDVISPQTFPHLTNLFELDVGSNRLRGVVPSLPRALEHLHMPRNQMAALPRAPSPDLLLPSLRTFDITGNVLHTLPSEGLISMPLLRKLYIGENSLTELNERAFDGLGRLEHLDLHDNRLLKVHDDSFRDLRRLRELNLRSNRIEKIQPNLFRENRALRSLDLSHNQLTDVVSSCFDQNRELRHISLSHNALNTFPPAVMNLQELKELDISHNRIHQLAQPLNKLRSLNKLKLSKNKLHTLLEGIFSSMPNLTTLDLDSNEIQFITPHVIRSMPSLLSLHLSKNRLAAIPSAAFSDLPSLLKVELQENQLTHLASDCFTGVPNLLMLNLSYNQLTGFDRAGLNGLKSLEILDLSHNKVSRFNSPAMPHLNSLIQLKMDNNRLCQIQGSPFSKMSHLRMLSLRNNKLTSLPENVFEPIRNTMYELDVEGNPLRCSCSLLWLQAIIREGPHPGPRCSDGSYLKEYRLSRKNCIEPKQIDLIPECEELKAVGPTQQLSSLNDAKNPNHRPSPEESEYFYEEYVEYEENVTLPYNLSRLFTTTTTTRSPPITAVASTKIPPGVLSHFIPGDTPTLYAGSKPDEGKNQKPSGPTFTFFGMPLPSLNLGSFWGSGRNSDGKGRFPGPRGRVQQLPHLEKGFVPVLPGSGGFRPIFDPYLKHNKSEHEFHPSNHSWDGPYPQATISKVVPTKNELRPMEVNQIAQLTAMSEQKTNVNQERKPHVTTILPERYTTDVMFKFNRLEPETTTQQPMGYTEEPTTHFQHFTQTETTMQSNIDNDAEQTTQNPSVNSFNNKGGPSSLSGFLAPGGQLPPYKPPGRPTITKVTVGPPLGPGPPPVAEEIQGPIPRQPKSSPNHYYTPSPRLNSSISWYYKNYNNTNLEPYISGPVFKSSSLAYLPNMMRSIFLSISILVIF